MSLTHKVLPRITFKIDTPTAHHLYMYIILSSNPYPALFVCFFVYFLLEFDLPTYSITPSAHPVKCPPQCLSPSHPIPLPTSPSTTPCSFPRVRSLSCSVTSLIFPTHFLSFPLVFFIAPWSLAIICLLSPLLNQNGKTLLSSSWRPSA